LVFICWSTLYYYNYCNNYIFFLYKFIAGYLEGILLFPLTIIVATTILSFATVGLMLHTLKPEGVYIPINIIWFLGFITLSFNLYQSEDN